MSHKFAVSDEAIVKAEQREPSFITWRLFSDKKVEPNPMKVDPIDLISDTESEATEVVPAPARYAPARYEPQAFVNVMDDDSLGGSDVSIERGERFTTGELRPRAPEPAPVHVVQTKWDCPHWACNKELRSRAGFKGHLRVHGFPPPPRRKMKRVVAKTRQRKRSMGTAGEEVASFYCRNKYCPRYTRRFASVYVAKRHYENCDFIA
jgi:hypothetical protein